MVGSLSGFGKIGKGRLGDPDLTTERTCSSGLEEDSFASLSSA